MAPPRSNTPPTASSGIHAAIAPFGRDARQSSDQSGFFRRSRRGGRVIGESLFEARNVARLLEYPLHPFERTDDPRIDRDLR